jgi:hypothetical protein
MTIRRIDAEEIGRDIAESDDTDVVIGDIFRWSDDDLYEWLASWGYTWSDDGWRNVDDEAAP